MHFYKFWLLSIRRRDLGFLIPILLWPNSAVVLLEVTELPFKRRVIRACNLIVAHVNLTNGLAWCGRSELELLFVKS